MKDSTKEQWRCSSGRTVACCTLPHLGLQLTPRKHPYAVLLSLRYTACPKHPFMLSAPLGLLL